MKYEGEMEKCKDSCRNGYRYVGDVILVWDDFFGGPAPKAVGSPGGVRATSDLKKVSQTTPKKTEKKSPKPGKA